MLQGGELVFYVQQKTGRFGSIRFLSIIGYETQEIAVGNRSTIDLSLAAGTSTLNEVVVTALGIKKDIRQTGVAIQTVDGASLIKAREPNPINNLVGKVAGLTIGASAELLRRPSIVLRCNSDVLFVVDGVPINSDTWNISNDDIETYTVLKGASASALYGFRGKNGAILITTKRGFSVDVNTSHMFDRGFNHTGGPGHPESAGRIRPRRLSTAGKMILTRRCGC